MCRYAEELWEEASDPRLLFCGLVMLGKSKCYVYLSLLLVFVFGHFLHCLVHEELWEEALDPRPLFCG